MRKILVWLVGVLPLLTQAQDGDWNPYVANGAVTPAPLMPIEDGGTGTVSFNVGNSGSSPLELQGNPIRAMELYVTLSNGEPNVADPNNEAQVLASMTGTFVAYFTWSYDNGSKTFTGIQSQDIPGGIFAVGDINIPYRVTTNSVQASPQNGFNCNLVPPPYTQDINTEGDDDESSYTWTLAPLLPVTGLALDALRNGADVNLQWQTVSETNTKQFDLERSLDGQHFTYVATLKAAGNSQGKATYKFTDKNMNASVVYYRVKLTDINGKLNMSNVAVVRMANGGAVKVFPNPVRTHFYVRFDRAGKYSMQLIDVAGKTVYTGVAESAGMGSTLKIERRNLAAGSYHMKVSDDAGNSYTTQLVLVN